MLSPRSCRSRLGCVIATTLFSLSLACVAQAEDGDSFRRKGLFLGVGGSYAIDTQSEGKLESELCGNFCDIDVDDSLGMNLSVGYRHSEYLWTQLEMEYFEGLEASADGYSGSVEYAIITTSGNVMAGIAIGPLRPYLLGGVGFTVIDFDSGGPSKSGLSLRGGAGFDLEVTSFMSINIKCSYVLPFQDAEDFDYVSSGIGLLFHF
jgi:opacity protein-like surface antigen